MSVFSTRASNRKGKWGSRANHNYEGACFVRQPDLSSVIIFIDTRKNNDLLLRFRAGFLFICALDLAYDFLTSQCCYSQPCDRWSSNKVEQGTMNKAEGLSATTH
jgi:hypothetical protein